MNGSFFVCSGELMLVGDAFTDFAGPGSKVYLKRELIVWEVTISLKLLLNVVGHC